MSAESHPEEAPKVDLKGLIGGMIESDHLARRVTSHSQNIFIDLSIEFEQIGVEVDMESFAESVETRLEEYIDISNLGKSDFRTDTRALNKIGAAIVIELRELDVPLTSDEVAGIIISNTTPEDVVDRFDDVTAVYVEDFPDNIMLEMEDRNYHFRLESEDGEAPATKEIQAVLGGFESSDEDRISELSEYMFSPDVAKKYINRSKRKMDAAEGEFHQQVEPAHFIDRFNAVFNLADETVEKARDVVDAFPDSSRQSVMIAAASLWIAAQDVGEPLNQKDIVDEVGVSGAGIRKTMEDVDIDFDSVFFKNTTTLSEGGITKLPDTLLEWVGAEGKYIEYPRDVFGADEGSKVELSLVDEVPDDGVLIEGSITESDLDQDSSLWSPVDGVPMPASDIVDDVPNRGKWGYDNDSDESVIYLTVTEV